jgi:hypothetical protein
MNQTFFLANQKEYLNLYHNGNRRNSEEFPKKEL